MSPLSSTQITTKNIFFYSFRERRYNLLSAFHLARYHEYLSMSINSFCVNISKAVSYFIVQMHHNFVYFFIEVQFIYMVSDGQQSDSVTHTCIFSFFSIISYYNLLHIFSYPIQQVLIVYLLYIQWCVSVNPKALIYPSPTAFPVW